MALNLKEQTLAQFAVRFWGRVRDAQQGNKVEFHRLMWRLWTWVTNGDITATQARNSFNTAFGKTLTATQWNTLWNSRVIPAKDRYLALMAEGAING